MIKQKKLKDYKSYKDVSKMVMSCLQFYGIALLVLWIGGTFGSKNGGWGGIIFGIAYVVGILIFSVNYGVKFVIKKENIIILCVIYFVFTYISWIFFSGISSIVNAVSYISFYNKIKITLILTFLTFAFGLFAKLIYRPVKIAYLDSEIENNNSR